MRRHVVAAVALLAGVLLLAGCASAPSRPPPLPTHCVGGAMPANLAAIPMPTPVPEPPSRYGNRSSYQVFGRTYHVLSSARGYDQTGIASWYGQRSQGKLTSNLEHYDLYKYTAASKVLPLPTFVRVTNLDNGKCVIVRVNDRGPFVHGRIIDLSYLAALRLGVWCSGTAPVRVQAIDANDPAQVRALSCPAAGWAAPAPPPPPASPASVAPAPTPPTSVPAPPLPMPGPAPAASLPAMQAPRSARVIYLQVGVFTVQADAERVLQLLRDNQLNDANIRTITFDGQSLWFVRVGPLHSAAAAAVTPRLILLGLPVLRIDEPLPSH